MKLLLAKNYVQARYYLDNIANKKDGGDVYIVNDEYQIRGVERGTTILLYGDFLGRSDAHRILDLISAGGLKKEYV